MSDFIFSQFLFYISIAIVLFIPGYFLLLATFGKNSSFSFLDKFLISFGSSILSIDFLILLLGKFKIPITRISILSIIIIFSAFCGLIFYFKNKNNQTKSFVQKQFSRKHVMIVLVLIFLTVFIKTIYLRDAIFPTATDLGHHCYWAKTITITGQLPVYEKVDITEKNTISEPQPIADFIIGEHLILAAINLISGIDYVSYFPVLILYLVNIMTVLCIFSLTRLLFKDSANGDNVAIIALLLIGPIYALSSPETKFASGGVIGNTLGNFFIPLAIYFFVRALSEKSSASLAYAIFITIGLAYTHHLSTFVFIFIFIFSFIFFCLFNFKRILPYLKEWLKLIFSPSVLAIIAMGIIFILSVYTPTYLNAGAVDTAVGKPSKETRTGLTPQQLKFTAGEARMAIGAVGILLLLLAKKKSTYGSVFLLGWGISLTIMSLKPGWLFIDIPSNRIASYITFPMAIFASYGLVSVLTAIKTSEKQYMRSPIFLSAFFMLMTFIITNGFYDNSQSLNTSSKPEGALQTYQASKYLATVSNKSDIILKDHNYLAADSWIKLSFMRGYNYPLSRGYFKRYTDETKQREQCTNYMISSPNSIEAKECFQGTGTDFLMINPNFDAAQFKKSKNFWQIYAGDDVSIFYKNN